MMSAYLVDVIVLLMAAVIAVPLFQAARLGAVPGFLVAGIAVGPSGLGLIANVSEISNLAEIGVVLLLFVIGIELKPSRLWLMRRLVFGLGSLQVVVTGALLAAAAHWVFNISLRASILIGPALALSSTAFVLQVLTEQKMMTSLYGRASIGVLLLQDLAVVPLLALIPLLAMPEMTISEDIGLALAESLLILFLVVVIGRYLLHPILHRVANSKNAEVFTASALLIVLGTALLTEHAGLSMAMGAFIAGLLMSDSFYRHQVLAEIQPFRGLLLGLFFMSMGMSLNLGLLIADPLQALVLAGLLIGLKAAVLLPIAVAFRLRARVSAAVALVLGQSGEFALVLFSLARQAALMSDQLFQQLLLIVLLSMMVTPVLAHLARRLVSASPVESKQEPEPAPPEAPIVLAGFGRMGHRVGQILLRAGKSFVALDSDAELVEKERAGGYPVFFGDVRKPGLLKVAGAGNARIIIVTLDDPAATREVVASLRKSYPETSIYARGRNRDECRTLHRLGATGVVSETIEASIELTRMALVDIGLPDQVREPLLADFRHAYRGECDRAEGTDMPKA